MTKICAIMVVYEADENRLIDVVNAVSTQLEKLIIYENSRISESSKDKLEKIDKVTFLGTGENIGLSIPFNIALDYAIQNDMEYLLFLDQDSILRSQLSSHFNRFTDNVIAICPRWVDSNSSADIFGQYAFGSISMYRLDVNKENYVSHCINSGLLIKVDRFASLNVKFDENLFVDMIDNDFCWRLFPSRILYVPEYKIEHQLGSKRIQSIIGVTVRKLERNKKTINSITYLLRKKYYHNNNKIKLYLTLLLLKVIFDVIYIKYFMRNYDAK